MSTATIELPAPYLARPLRPEDAQAVTDLMAACELHDLGEVQIELEDVLGDWQRPSFDLAAESVGVYDEHDGLVAYAEVYNARRADAYVLPQVRGRGIGTALMSWTRRTARERGGTLVGQTVPQRLTDAVALFEANGYHARWTSWILQLPEGAEVAAGPLPERTRIRALVPGRDERAAYQTVEEAFSEWPDRDPVSFADWAAVVLRRPGFEPWQLLLAVEQDATGEQVVGVCFVIPSRDTGWVQYLAVRRDRRGRGLARALLLRAFAEARARGMTGAELNTDTRTGALDLYLHVGMRVKETFVHYARAIDRPQRARGS
ncbi:MAG: GNAT family N-acetyltransferase [Actinomycetota bacterium]|nr:GNAT family N-acetyltransferase [Actinomycetota bacterium]